MWMWIGVWVSAWSESVSDWTMTCHVLHEILSFLYFYYGAFGDDDRDGGGGGGGDYEEDVTYRLPIDCVVYGGADDADAHSDDDGDGDDDASRAYFSTVRVCSYFFVELNCRSVLWAD